MFTFFVCLTLGERSYSIYIQRMKKRTKKLNGVA